MRTLFGHDQRALELPRLRIVNAEVSRQLHRTTHALRDKAETSIRKHCAVQRRIEIVIRRHDRAQILANNFRVLSDRFAERTEDHAVLPQFFFVGRRDRN